MRGQHQHLLLPLLLLATLSTTACGYRLYAPGSQLPGGVRAVEVAVFENRTAEPGAEALFTQALREQLFKAGRLADGAPDARLEGALLAVASAPLLGAPGRQPTYRLTATVELVLRQGATELARLQLTGTEDYPAGADVLWAETNRTEALHRLAVDLMRQGLERLAERV